MTQVFRSLHWDWLWSKARFDTLLVLLSLSLLRVRVPGLVRELSSVPGLGLVRELSSVRVPGLVRELVLGLALEKGLAI